MAGTLPRASAVTSVTRGLLNESTSEIQFDIAIAATHRGQAISRLEMEYSFDGFTTTTRTCRDRLDINAVLFGVHVPSGECTAADSISFRIKAYNANGISYGPKL